MEFAAERFAEDNCMRVALGGEVWAEEIVQFPVKAPSRLGLWNNEIFMEIVEESPRIYDEPELPKLTSHEANIIVEVFS